MKQKITRKKYCKPTIAILGKVSGLTAKMGSAGDFGGNYFDE